MKKLISLMLALIMVFSLATVVAADEVATTDVKYGAADSVTINLTKNYAGTDAVTETLTFKSVPGDNPTDQNLTFGTYTVSDEDYNTAGVPAYTVRITTPEYTAAGEYHYNVTETSGQIQGMDYSDTEVDVVVLVGYDNDNSKYKVLSAGAVQPETGDKVESYTNTLTTYALTVDKTVTGNYANKNDKFPFKVTITADEGMNLDTVFVNGGKEEYVADAASKEYTFSISDADGKYTISGIPSGAKVEITETDDGEYTFKESSGGDNNAQTVTINDMTSNKDVTFTNERDEEVKTGIVTDSAPYIILIAVCAVAAVAFVLKRRNAVEF